MVKKGGTAGLSPVPSQGGGLFAFHKPDGEGRQTNQQSIGGDAGGVYRRVGYQGEPGAYSEVAAAKIEPAAGHQPCRTLGDVFELVEAGELDAGVVAIENSLAGSIGETYDLLVSNTLAVTGETTIPVDHCLMAQPGTELTAVRRVISHPQALAQCRAYLEGLGVELVPHYNTAGAAKEVATGAQPGLAAVASGRAAEIYGLSILASGIQDDDGNQTRFLRVEREPRPTNGRPQRKWVLAVTLPHQPGSLFMALSAFACRGINLTRIESRPIKGDPWNYTFYLELESPGGEWAVAEALTEPDTELRLFGKPSVKGRRRMGVALARGATVEEARSKARRAAECVRVVSS